MLGQFGPQQNQSKYAKKMGDFAQEKAIEAQQKTEELETVIDDNRFNFKGEVATRSAIPSSKSFGDAWFILDEGRTVRWNGTALENRNTNNPSQIQNLAEQLDDLEGQFDAAVGAVTVDSEVVLARDSAVKGKTFATLDGRLEELDNDAYFPIKNEVVNGDLPTTSSSGFLINNGTIAVSGGVAKITSNGTAKNVSVINLTGENRIIGNVYYSRAKFRALSVSPGYFLVVAVGTGFTQVFTPVVGEWHETSAIGIASSNTTTAHVRVEADYGTSAQANGKEFEVDNMLSINLTKFFGAGNEPTKEEMDKILSFYPDSFFNGTVNLAENKKMLKFLLNEIRSKANKTQETPLRPTLLNSWVDFNTSLFAHYWKSSSGNVHLGGLIKSGVINPGTGLFVLPTGYRPTTNKYLLVNNNNKTAAINVFADGSVQIVSTGADSTWLSLDGISFRLDT